MAKTQSRSHAAGVSAELAALFSAVETYLARHGNDAHHANVVNAAREVMRRIETDEPIETKEITA